MKKTAVDFFGIPFEKRLCRVEMHLTLMGSDFDNKRPSYSQFNGVDIEEYVDQLAKRGLQVWYTGLPHCSYHYINLAGGSYHHIKDNKM